MARSFNGTTDFISATIPGSSTYTDMTFAFWNNPGVQASGYAGILQGANAPLLYIHQTTLLFAYYIFFGQSADPAGTGAGTQGVWTHFALAGSGTGTGNVINTYVSGANVNSVTANSATTPYFGAFNIGQDAPNAPRWFAGGLADMTVWSVRLTPLEIAALAKGVRPNRIRRASMLNWWPLLGRVSPEPDLSGNAVNGNLTGTALSFDPPFGPFTPLRPLILPAAAAAPSAIFRKTLSSVGTRTGSRQVQGGM